jgi:hypothetical protein
MSLEHPSYWLAYLSDAAHVREGEVTAVAPGILPRPAFSPDAQMMLAAADVYHADNPTERVVFAAAITRWLHVEYGLRWADIDVDFFDALSDLDAHAPALLIEASPIAPAIVANAALSLEIRVITDEPLDSELPTEPVRAALTEALVRDWPPYIRAVVEDQRKPVGVRPS